MADETPPKKAPAKKAPAKKTPAKRAKGGTTAKTRLFAAILQFLDNVLPCMFHNLPYRCALWPSHH